MGELDPGVWFACSTTDPLHNWRLIQESIRTIKESRHGIPFGIHISGVNLRKDLPLLAELRLDRVQVALLVANPKDYASATGMSDAEAQKCFSRYELGPEDGALETLGAKVGLETGFTDGATGTVVGIPVGISAGALVGRDVGPAGGDEVGDVVG
jgi:hypothetical protein